MKRREFISLSASMVSALGFSNLTACTTKNTAEINTSNVIIGGYRHTDENGARLSQHGVLAVQAIDETKHTSDNYQLISDFTVPNEVHLATLYPNGKSILVCSRKPGASLLKYSLQGELLAELKPLSNQHFEGHGIFSLDEKLIYVTASDFQQTIENKKGRILTLNSKDLTLVSDDDSGGIGPHELVWQSDTHIAIANTGVLTHPDSGRKILNKDNIQSNIILFNTDTKSIDQQWQVPLLGLSARHMDRMDNGDLVIGCQYKKQDQRPACVAFAKKNKDLIFSDKNNESLHWDMKGYTASIKALPNSNKALITNPRGHLLTQWQNPIRIDDKAASTQLVYKQKIQYNKGIKINKTGEQAWVSQGAGELLLLNTKNNNLSAKNSVKVKQRIWWANHLG